jgi:hypothetical protein
MVSIGSNALGSVMCSILIQGLVGSQVVSSAVGSGRTIVLSKVLGST